MTTLKDYAIVVGINDYSDPSITPLVGPRNDANKFAAWAAGQPNHGSVTVKVSVANTITPTFSELIAEIKALVDQAPNADARIGRRLYIFLAGHGVGTTLDDCNLLTADWSDQMPVHLAGVTCANHFRAAGLFHEVVLCMDCCRDIDRDLPSAYPFRVKLDPAAASRVKRFYALASGVGQKSRERDFGGTVYGLFSKVLLEGLDGEARDGFGKVTAGRLERYVKRRLEELQPNGKKQVADFSGDDDIVLVDGLSPLLLALSVTLTNPTASFAVLDGSTMQPVSQAINVVDATTRSVALPAGRAYVLRYTDAAGAPLKHEAVLVDEEAKHVTF